MWKCICVSLVRSKLSKVTTPSYSWIHHEGNKTCHLVGCTREKYIINFCIIFNIVSRLCTTFISVIMQGSWLGYSVCHNHDIASSQIIKEYPFRMCTGVMYGMTLHKQQMNTIFSHMFVLNHKKVMLFIILDKIVLSFWLYYVIYVPL